MEKGTPWCCREGHQGLTALANLTAGHGRVQAPLLAHTMLHHPRAWPKREAALGLLISLRKYLQTEWVRTILALCTLGNVLVLAYCLVLLHALAHDTVLATHPSAPLLTGTYLIACMCVFTHYEMTLCCQMRLHWDPKDTPFATLPVALLTAVVCKEAQLPEHTASLAATQLLPVILAFTKRHLASTAGRPPSTHVCQELLVRAKLACHRCCCRHQPSMWIPTSKRFFKRWDHGVYIACRPCCKAWVCCAGDVLLPSNQLSLARACRALGAGDAGCRHGTCLRHHRLTAHCSYQPVFPLRSANMITCALSAFPLLVTLLVHCLRLCRTCAKCPELKP